MEFAALGLAILLNHLILKVNVIVQMLSSGKPLDKEYIPKGRGTL